jgi:NAD-dependent deacetylase
MKPKLVILSGAGISAESGLATFRGADGLWEGHRVEEVATPEAWVRNPQLVLEFYNQRRKQALHAKPNEAHLLIKELEADFEVMVITQNVDNLHEKAGSKNILHLDGQLFQSRSTQNENLVLEMEGWELKWGDKGPDGAQLRPNIVWFGEAVPMMGLAVEEVENADYLAVVGTSLQVYPAASLVNYVPQACQIWVVDPGEVSVSGSKGVHYIREKATSGMRKLLEILRKPKSQPF